MMNECVFCNVANKKIEHDVFWEDERTVAFLDKNPVASGHTLIIPKEHIDYLFDASDELYNNLFRSSNYIAKALKEATRAKRIALIVSGFHVAHIHIHLVPANEETDIRKSAPAGEIGTKEKQKMIEEIRKYLA